MTTPGRRDPLSQDEDHVAGIPVAITRRPAPSGSTPMPLVDEKDADMTPTIKIETRDGITVVHIAGEMRGMGNPALLEAVSQLLHRDGARVVLEMGQVPFMGSAALADLVRISAEANTLGGRVVLANLTPFTKDLLATTKLDRFFEVHDDVDAASAALQ